MFRRLTYIHLAILIALLGACTTNQSPQPPPLDPQSRAQSDPKKKTVFVRAWTPPEKRLVTLGYVGDLPIRPELPNEPAFNTESYDHLEENPFLSVEVNPLSTFSIDVDTASYANVRRFITEGKLPPRDAVRLEELINYFDYDYLPPSGGDPFSVTVEVGECPWAGEHRLARIGLKAQVMLQKDRPPANLVFLLDVSGSMQSGNRLPLVKKSMRMLLGGLNTDDTVAIVVYAGAAGLVLPATPVSDREMILGALEQLEAGGSTAGGAGIQLAYNVARENLIPSGSNRVVLATDGDFNVGTSDRGSLIRLVQDEAKSGVFLTVLGFGMGNLKDDMLESLADKGNGNYAYIDGLFEARKVLMDQVGATLVTIAKDVKIQVEFNPAQVGAYRLIGYENRMLRAEDFNDDKKDAGEIGAGHTVTALYELVPADSDYSGPTVDPLKYQEGRTVSSEAGSGELLTVKVRYKEPDGVESQLISFPVTDPGTDFTVASADFKFAAAVASFGMILRESEHRGDSSWDSVLTLAEEGLGDDRKGYRSGFLDLVAAARDISPERTASLEEQ